MNQEAKRFLENRISVLETEIPVAARALDNANQEVINTERELVRITRLVDGLKQILRTAQVDPVHTAKGPIGQDIEHVQSGEPEEGPTLPAYVLLDRHETTEYQRLVSSAHPGGGYMVQVDDLTPEQLATRVA